mmetsp:Transcript_20040/g.64023  ORF Transcript_20040/g.64023 Transcript_20040/m.64023 type:complete len:557 (-) Transcript_20040:372-2042(-)
MSTDNFAAAQSRIASVLEEGVRADGLAGAAFVDSVVAAVRGAGASSGEAATSGNAEGANGAAAKAETLDAEERGTLELAMRIFLERKSSAGAAGALVVALIDRSIELATARVADLNTPFALMEDLFDSQVISESEALFPQIEQRGGALAKLMRSTNNRAKLTFIRTCNELLRRLSKSKNTNFCGRVLLLMAYMLPLSERSGVNLKGAMAPSDLELQPDEAADDKQEGSAAEDGSLYASFWGLQAAFADPAAAVKPESWATLLSRLETVLQVFANIVSTDAAPSAEAAHNPPGLPLVGLSYLTPRIHSSSDPLVFRLRPPTRLRAATRRRPPARARARTRRWRRRRRRWGARCTLQSSSRRQSCCSCSCVTPTSGGTCLCSSSSLSRPSPPTSSSARAPPPSRPARERRPRSCARAPPSCSPASHPTALSSRRRSSGSSCGSGTGSSGSATAAPPSTGPPPRRRARRWRRAAPRSGAAARRRARAGSGSSWATRSCLGCGTWATTRSRRSPRRGTSRRCRACLRTCSRSSSSSTPRRGSRRSTCSPTTRSGCGRRCA